MARLKERPAFLRMLGGILLSYALIIGFGDTAVGDAVRVGLLGFLLWIAIRVRGLGRYRWWILAGSAVLLTATALAAASGSARLASGVVGATTFVMITALIGAIVSIVLRIGQIDISAVLGVLCVYLLLALFFASVNQVVASMSHDYLHGTSDPPTASDLLYFSVITITTVGFGDITPVSEAARAVTVLEALTGQLYLVSVVAGVVGSWRGRRPGGSG